MDVSFSTQSLTIKEIVASDHPIITKAVTIAAGQNLVEGAVLGQITADGADKGKLVLSVAAAEDGSQVPYAILSSKAIDATAAAKAATAFVAGHFLGKNLTYGAGHTKDSVFDALRSVGVFVA